MSEHSALTETSIHLARERSREAADRTLLAWIRTSLSLIVFGFTIAKFYDYLEKAELRQAIDPIHSTLLFGGSFIVLRIFGLFAAIGQYRQTLERLENDQFMYFERPRLPMLMAFVLVMIGFFALAALFI